MIDMGNNLIMVKSEKSSKYFTNLNRAAKFVGIQPNSVSWAILNGNVIKDKEGNDITLSMVDGSEIPYKYINNN